MAELIHPLAVGFLKIISEKHQKFNRERVFEELLFMQEHDLVTAIEKNHLLVALNKIYQKVVKTPSKRGDKNIHNCYVGYLLGITSKKPDGAFHIPKRRNYARSGFPDVDMDFDCFRRHEIVEYLAQKYGKDHVAGIGAVQTLQIKAAIRRVIKALDPENSVVFGSDGKIIKDDQSENFRLQNEILNTLPEEPMKRPDGKLINSLDQAYNEFSEFRRYMDAYPEVFRVAKQLEGAVAASSMHAAGIVLSKMPLCTIAPLYVAKAKKKKDEDDDDEKTDSETLATQFTMEDVESIGLIKFDVLALSTKTAADWAINLIKENHGVDLDLANLPLDDQKTLALLSSGNTDMVFQCEGGGMKNALKSIGIDSFHDLAIAIAMYRPGPKDYIPELSSRKKNKSKISYAHPLLKEVTESTYGILVYQEQLMQIFMKFANLGEDEGYEFMKGCAKKKQEIIDKYKDKFILYSMKNGIPEHVVRKVAADLEKFGEYAFNRSHTYSYAYESWKTAYLKAHYPMEFMSSRLSVENIRRKFEIVEKYEQDCGRNNIKLDPPDLNKSKLIYSIVGERTLRRPLAMRGVGIKAAEDIVKHQPYQGNDLVYAFASKVGHAVNSKVIKTLAEMHVFGKISPDKALYSFELIKKDRTRSKGKPTKDMFG